MRVLFTGLAAVHVVTLVSMGTAFAATPIYPLAATSTVAPSAKSVTPPPPGSPRLEKARTEDEKSDRAKVPTPPTALPPALASYPSPQIVSYTSTGLQLRAFLYVPPGDGPFPTVLVNHGSEAQPNLNGAMLNFWLSRGFALFLPIRAGQGGNPGSYIVDGEAAAIDQYRAKKISLTTLGNDIVALHQKANQDVINAYKWLIGQPFTDKGRIVVFGGSYGGIQTLLTAQQNAVQKLGIRCFIDISPAAESWSGYWAAFLPTVVKSINAPIMLMQPANDYSLGPSATLGPLIDAKGYPDRHMVFPSDGDANVLGAGHGLFISDAAAWAGDVLAFLEDCGEEPRTPVVLGGRAPAQ